jgi:hypothetical protein
MQLAHEGSQGRCWADNGVCDLRLKRSTRMATFDYKAEAEFFPIRGRSSRRLGIGYRRFAHAADAIRFAIEELPAQFLAGAWLEVGEERFDATDIRRLYDSAEYPLARRAAP